MPTEASVIANQPRTMRARPLGFSHVTNPARQYTTLKKRSLQRVQIMVKEDKRIPLSGECMEYIRLNSESCKKADRYDRIDALRQSNHKHSVN